MTHFAPHIDLASVIEAHCAKSGVARSTFGDEATGDPSLFRDLRAGREPRQATVARVMDYILTGKTYAEIKAERVQE